MSTIERRLSGLGWNYTQRGFTLDRKNRHIATVLAGIKAQARPPPGAERGDPSRGHPGNGAPPYDLREACGIGPSYFWVTRAVCGAPKSSALMCTRTTRPIAAAGSRSEEKGALLTLNAKTGWREVEIGRGSSDQSCPVHALGAMAALLQGSDFGPVFQRVTRGDLKTTGARLSDKHVARLIKRTVLDAGIRGDLPKAECLALFSGHSLRAGLASSAEVDERYVQKQLGHASAEMTRRYQRRRDRFRVNLTKAAGL